MLSWLRTAEGLDFSSSQVPGVLVVIFLCWFSFAINTPRAWWSLRSLTLDSVSHVRHFIYFHGVIWQLGLDEPTPPSAHTSFLSSRTISKPIYQVSPCEALPFQCFKQNSFLIPLSQPTLPKPVLSPTSLISVHWRREVFLSKGRMESQNNHCPRIPLL